MAVPASAERRRRERSNNGLKPTRPLRRFLRRVWRSFRFFRLGLVTAKVPLPTRLACHTLGFSLVAAISVPPIPVLLP